MPLYERLRELARSRDLALYSKLAPLAGIDTRDPLFAVHVGTREWAADRGGGAVRCCPSR